jgi:hypothetical protein
MWVKDYSHSLDLFLRTIPTGAGHPGEEDIPALVLVCRSVMVLMDLTI